VLADGLKEGNYFFGSVVVASGAPFLAPFSSPASPLLTALCPRLWRVCGRCRGRGVTKPSARQIYGFTA